MIKAYMTAIHTVFIMYAPMIGICSLTALFVKDHGVAEKDATEAERRTVSGVQNEGIMLQNLDVAREAGEKTK